MQRFELHLVVPEDGAHSSDSRVDDDLGDSIPAKL